MSNTSPELRPGRPSRLRPGHGLLGALLLALAASLPALAQDRPAFLDPNLALSVEADSAELSQENNVSIYRGNVVLERGPLVMRGEVLRIAREPDSGRIRAELRGSPARAEYTDPANPAQPVVAQARAIEYTTIVELLRLEGGASIRRGEDRLEGESVRYDIPQARIQADGGNERVRIVIQPPENAEGRSP